MSAERDVQRLLDWFDAGALLRPTPAAPNIVSLGQAMLSLIGAPGVTLDAQSAAFADAIGRHEHYVFVLCDGIGMNLVETLPPDAFFRRNLAMEMRTLFPSSTAPALTSLATGVWSPRHAVPSWWTYMPEAGLTATILKYIERYSEKPLQDFGVGPEQTFPLPSALADVRHDVMGVTPAYIASSTTSRYLYAQAPYVGYEHLGDAADAIVARIAAARAPTFTYFYIPYVDAAEHTHGVRARPVREALDRVDRSLGRLAEALAGRARMVATADHGLIDIQPGSQRILKDDEPMLAHLVCPPAGEPQAPAFHVRDGQGDAFAAMFREQYGETWALISIDDAHGLGLFGPDGFSEIARPRFGDFIAVNASAREMAYGMKPEGLHGSHGALSPGEMRIPLVLA